MASRYLAGMPRVKSVMALARSRSGSLPHTSAYSLNFFMSISPLASTARQTEVAGRTRRTIAAGRSTRPPATGAATAVTADRTPWPCSPAP